MSRIAIVSDIHSNLEALVAVMRDIEAKRVKKIYCLGDLIGYGPNPNEVIDIARDNFEFVIKGNHDEAVAYKILDLGGGEPTIAPRGTGEGQVVVLLGEGAAYEYAIGIEPGNNAANFYKLALGRVETSLEEMDKAEEKALKALKKYSEDPNVDGPQSLPEE